jgi:hypothetical protein
MSAATLSRPKTTFDLPKCMDALERLLRTQLDGYARLLAAIERQREAIRVADPAALEQAALEQESIVRALGQIDHQRVQVISALQKHVEPAAKQTPTLTALLERAAIDDERRTRLLALAADLRDKVAAAKREGGIVRDAAEALCKHMAGIQQTVHSALSRARIYERRGRLNLGSAVPATVDMKS